MSGGFRSKTGCFTCKVRKKKCDEQKPACLTCESRDIVCYGYGRRPEWMAGMRNWKEIMESREARLIRESADRNYRAKRGIQSRKEKEAEERAVQRQSRIRWQETLTTATYGLKNPTPRWAWNQRLALLPESRHENDTDEEYTIISAPSVLSSSDSVTAIPPSPGVIWWDEGLESTHLNLRVDCRLLLIFLDTIFPLQYGFYGLKNSNGPNNLDWLIHLLYTTEPFYQALLTLCISFETGLQHTGSNLIAAERRGDLRPDARALQTHAIHGLQQWVDELSRIKDSDPVELLCKSTQALAVIQQLMGIEVFNFVSGNWGMHVNAARQILAMLQRRGVVCENANRERYKDVPAELAALDFYLAGLVWAFVISDATFGLHASTGGAGGGQDFDYINMLKKGYINPQKLMGCDNKVMAAIAEISALELLRAQVTNQADEYGSKGASAVAMKATHVQRDLHHSIWTARQLQDDVKVIGLEKDSAVVSNIFAHAALIYLHTMILSGAASYTYIMEEYVTRCLELFEVLPPRLLIRVCWPLTVAASMAPLEQHGRWRLVLLKGMREKTPLGMVWQGMRVAEECWRLRDLEPQRSWTWRDALSNMRAMILLV